MAKSASTLGHLALLLGLLAVIVKLNQIAIESSSYPGTATPAFYMAIIAWVVAVLLVVAEWFQPPLPA